MTIVAGMLLTCWVRISDPGQYGSFVKDVPTKVKFVDNKTGKAFVEYDFEKAPGIYYIGDPVQELIHVEDLKSKTYGRCK